MSKRNKGFMPITKRTDPNWNHGVSTPVVTDEQLKVLINECGFTPERAKTLTKTQAQYSIEAHRSRFGKPNIPRTNLVKLSPGRRF